MKYEANMKLIFFTSYNFAWAFFMNTHMPFVLCSDSAHGSVNRDKWLHSRKSLLTEALDGTLEIINLCKELELLKQLYKYKIYESVHKFEVKIIDASVQDIYKDVDMYIDVYKEMKQGVPFCH